MSEKFVKSYNEKHDSEKSSKIWGRFVVKNNNTKRLLIAVGVLAVLVAVVFFVVPLSLAAIRKGKQQNTSNQVVNDTKVEKVTEDAHKGEARSKITGKWIDEKDADNVPFAVMYSNIADAMPQSNIGTADVVFESLVEGGITRLCCLFDNQTQLEKIGPVRSCRTYYLLFAKEFEAVYVHFGYSEYAADYLKQDQFHSLDGMVYCDFYRSDDRIAPHNAYTSWKGILASAQAREYSTVYPDNYQSPFLFNTDDKKDVDLNQGAAVCKTFQPGYPYNKPWFEYNETSKTYDRFQFEGPQIDRETGQQLTFKNILVKYVEPDYYDNGTPNYKINGTGKGLYITDGKAVEVTWKKDSETEGPTQYFYSDGSQVVMNQGKTYICQVESTQEVTISDGQQ